MIKFEDMYYWLKKLGFEVYTRFNDECTEDIIMTNGVTKVTIIGDVNNGMLLAYCVME